MKKFIFLFAVAVMFAFTACKSGTKTEVATGDSTEVSTKVDTTIVETTTTADTIKK